MDPSPRLCQNRARRLANQVQVKPIKCRNGVAKLHAKPQSIVRIGYAHQPRPRRTDRQNSRNQPDTHHRAHSSDMAPAARLTALPSRLTMARMTPRYWSSTVAKWRSAVASSSSCGDGPSSATAVRVSPSALPANEVGPTDLDRACHHEGPIGREPRPIEP